ncbi:glycosyltransferase [Microbacterium imperiale]|uniref:glycosyltransferase n=1 Tax=Microbacterium imperiale TaxID=33884 RepID=UPI001AE581E6|nr:glycosyltransferase [Microbacterium imperiale]MBP2420524.1 glycosyltransferase involved in cell wall biosynthesis [Microbacterium imperiale]MDS0200346.1 glycosyltransferase [Microbacterium imperiale]BFE40865.1 glycosyltransferase family 4 protein [Microbacterium imperiale]
MTGIIIHEWIERSGGAERVVDAFTAQFPDAPVFTLWSDVSGRYDNEVIESWISRTPLRQRKALALPFMLPTWRLLRAIDEPEWALISSHLFAHHARHPRFPDVPKMVYAHTPARYIWEPERDSRGAGPLARAASRALRPIDRRRAREATAIAVNSEFTRHRTERAWNRDAEVIYPPVDTARLVSGGDWSSHLSAREEDIIRRLPETYLLGASRMVPYKRLDLVIAAAEANDLPVVLAGAGPDRGRLASIAEGAHVNTLIIDNPSDALLYTLIQRALVFIFPAIEDFGILPVEAMTLGTPVVTATYGGAAESVQSVGGGSHLEGVSPENFRSALQAALSVNTEALPERCSVFSVDRFQRDIDSWFERNSVPVPSIRNEH